MRTFNVLTAISVFALLFLLLAPFAAANVVTTTMTWFVASVKTISVSYGSPCSSAAFFFNESNAQYDTDTDANWARAVPQSTRTGAGDTNCQSSSQAGITIQNVGTATVNVDFNFSDALSGADVNLELKVWQGSAGCGTNGMGGWEEPCSVTSTTSAPGTTTCKEWSSGTGTDTEGSRVVTSLATYATQQLCFSGDLNGSTGLGGVAGDHNQTGQWGSDFS